MSALGLFRRGLVPGAAVAVAASCLLVGWSYAGETSVGGAAEPTRTGQTADRSTVGGQAGLRAAPLRAGPLQAAPPVWPCGQVTGMDVVDGFLKPRAGAPTRPHAFYLARAMYSGRSRGFGGRGGGGGWATDYPTADRVMTRVATRLSNLDACEWEFPISLADPDLRRYPFLYTVEWGRADLTEREAEGLREYLLAGGFLMVDDFWGTQEWRDFEEQFRRVLPEHAIVEVPRDHPIFRSYYEIDEEIMQVPNIRNGEAVGMGFPGASTSERDGYQAHLRGVFDERGRLMVAINWNTDLGDALEWAESPSYPLVFSTFASRLFLNLIVYAMAF